MAGRMPRAARRVHGTTVPGYRGAMQIRFCSSFDGTRLAYAVQGSGLAVLRAPHWLTHLEYEGQSPIWKPWIAAFTRRFRLVRMDERACGLSDWDVGEVTFESAVRDLEAVADAAGIERFALFGHSQGGAISVAYAARHPERVSHLVLLGAYARGAYRRGLGAHQREELEAQLKLVEHGWGRDDPSYRQMFAAQFLPGATLEELAAMSELQRRSASAANAVRVIRSFLDIDVTEAAAAVRCPTLVLHARGDRRVPFEEGRLLAGLIPGARFEPLESANHILLAHEPSFVQFFDAVQAFLAGEGDAAPLSFVALTPRERQVLGYIAEGRDNAQIAAQLGLSDKTVRNNITHIFDKLGVQTRAQAIVLARENGFGKR